MVSPPAAVAAAIDRARAKLSARFRVQVLLLSESTIAIYGPAGHAILTAARITLTNGVDVFPDGRLELDTPQP